MQPRPAIPACKTPASGLGRRRCWQEPPELLTRLPEQHTGRQANRDRQHGRAHAIREQSERRVERVESACLGTGRHDLAQVRSLVSHDPEPRQQAA